MVAKEIADHLGIAISTVNKHLQNIYTKLQARNARQAISQFFPQKKKSGGLRTAAEAPARFLNHTGPFIVNPLMRHAVSMRNTHF